jgi:hypothetical protein
MYKYQYHRAVRRRHDGTSFFHTEADGDALGLEQSMKRSISASVGARESGWRPGLYGMRFTSVLPTEAQNRPRRRHLPVRR